MKEIGGRADFLVQLLGKSTAILNGFGKLGVFSSAVGNQSVELHHKRGNGLTGAVMEFTGDPAALLVLSDKETVRKVAEFLGLPENVSITLFELRRADANFGIQALCEGAVFLLAAAQRFGRLFAFGNVASDLGRADDAAASVADGRNRKRDMQRLAALGDTDGLKMVDALTLSKTIEDGGLLAAAVLWNDYGDVLTDSLGRGVAKQALGTLIPAGNDAVEILTDNGVVRTIDNGSQQRSRPLTTQDFDACSLDCGGQGILLLGAPSRCLGADSFSRKMPSH